jgi:hypothetical protein
LHGNFQTETCLDRLMLDVGQGDRYDTCLIKYIFVRQAQPPDTQHGNRHLHVFSITMSYSQFFTNALDDIIR